jgi:hypothetical protein
MEQGENNYCFCTPTETIPRLLTGGTSAKNLPEAGFLNAAGFPLFSAGLELCEVSG